MLLRAPTRSAILLLASLFLSLTGYSQQEPLRGETPEWVKPVELPEASVAVPEDISQGVWYLAFSQQANDITSERYNFYAIQVINNSGVDDASTITIGYDPSYQSLTFHSLEIHRDGEIANRLDQQKIEILRTETDRESSVYNNESQAHIIIEDLRVGDKLVYSYSIQGRNTSLGEFLDTSFTTSWSVPLYIQHARLLFSEDKNVAVRHHKKDVDWQVTSQNGIVEYEAILRNQEIVIEEDILPVWYSPWSYTEFSSFESWKDVSIWGKELFQSTDDFNGELREKIDEIRTVGSPSEQIVAALRLCQDEIRYTSISIGEHNYKPYPLNIVYTRRFGDCKDKSRLLAAILVELGFEATPALAQTYSGKVLDRNLPAPSNFNHVITKLVFDGETYWLDPTRSFQRGPLATLYESDYGYVLPLDGESEALEWSAGRNQDKVLITVNEKYKELANNEATLSVISRYEGVEADWMRSYTSGNSKSDIERNYLNHYANYFPEIEIVGTHEFDDNEETNIFTVQENYRIKKFLTPEEEESDDVFAYFQASTIHSAYSDPKTRIRKMPIGQTHPKRLIHNIEIDFHESIWEFEKEDRKIENAGFKFSYKTIPTASSLVLKYEYESLADSIAAEDSAKYIADISRLEDYIYYSIVNYGDVDLALGDRDIYYGYLFAGVGVLLFTLPMAFSLIFLPRKRTIEAEDPRLRDKLHGLSGWLLLVGLGVTIRPFLSIYYYLDPEVYLTTEDWILFTSPGKEFYSPTNFALFYFESIAQGIQISLSFATLILFYRKSRLFPGFFIGLLCYEFVVAVLDTIGVAFMVDPTLIIGGAFSTLVSSILAGILWVTYALVSKRVKTTFIY